MAALAVATGRADILGLDVERGRVLYLAIENPDDTVSRFTIAQRFHRIQNLTLRNRLFIVTVKATPEAVFAALENLARSGEFALVIVDTLAAYFDGTDMNDNVAAGNFMRRLRALSTVLGNPAVVIPAHPIKGADQSKLSPYGGGAIINEVDGNLTLWRRGNACRLHWQTKLRGPDFAPVFFRFREYGCDEVRRREGASRRSCRCWCPTPKGLPSLSLCQRPPDPSRDLNTSSDGPERRCSCAIDRKIVGGSDDASPDAKLLRAMIADPKGTQAGLGDGDRRCEEQRQSPSDALEGGGARATRGREVDRDAGGKESG